MTFECVFGRHVFGCGTGSKLGVASNDTRAVIRKIFVIAAVRKAHTKDGDWKKFERHLLQVKYKINQQEAE